MRSGGMELFRKEPSKSGVVNLIFMAWGRKPRDVGRNESFIPLVEISASRCSILLLRQE
jgi:hypothetical protein